MSLYIKLTQNNIKKLIAIHSVLKGEELTNKVFKLIQVLFPEYAENLEGIELERVSGAMTKYVLSNFMIETPIKY